MIRNLLVSVAFIFSIPLIQSCCGKNIDEEDQPFIVQEAKQVSESIISDIDRAKYGEMTSDNVNSIIRYLEFYSPYKHPDAKAYYEKIPVAANSAVLFMREHRREAYPKFIKQLCKFVQFQYQGVDLEKHQALIERRERALKALTIVNDEC